MSDPKLPKAFVYSPREIAEAAKLLWYKLAFTYKVAWYSTTQAIEDKGGMQAYLSDAGEKLHTELKKLPRHIQQKASDLIEEVSHLEATQVLPLAASLSWRLVSSNMLMRILRLTSGGTIDSVTTALMLVKLIKEIKQQYTDPDISKELIDFMKSRLVNKLPKNALLLTQITRAVADLHRPKL
jgi:hypothetical protein